MNTFIIKYPCKQETLYKTVIFMQKHGLEGIQVEDKRVVPGIILDFRVIANKIGESDNETLHKLIDHLRGLK